MADTVDNSLRSIMRAKLADAKYNKFRYGLSTPGSSTPSAGRSSSPEQPRDPLIDPALYDEGSMSVQRIDRPGTSSEQLTQKMAPRPSVSGKQPRSQWKEKQATNSTHTDISDAESSDEEDTHDVAAPVNQRLDFNAFGLTPRTPLQTYAQKLATDIGLTGKLLHQALNFSTVSSQ